MGHRSQGRRSRSDVVFTGESGLIDFGEDRACAKKRNKNWFRNGKAEIVGEELRSKHSGARTRREGQGKGTAAEA